jgi:integrase
MSSIHKRDKSPYWFCSFQAPDGRWVKKSTKIEAKEGNREMAQDLCREWSKAGRAARNKTLVTAQARKILNEFLDASGDTPLDNFTVESWVTDWACDKEGSRSPATVERYNQVTRDFLKTLGDRKTLPLRAMTPSDIRKFRDALTVKGLTAGSANHAHKILIGVFNPAVRQGILPSNPATAVSFLSAHKEKARREPFTVEEVEKLFSVADADWKGAILSAFYLGLRLGDIATLRWGAVDLAAGTITLTPQKTERLGKVLVLPIAEPLQTFLISHPMGKADAFVFPSLAKKRIPGRNGLSMDFRKIMDAAGVAAGVAREKLGAGGHTTAQRSFHSLRHTNASLIEKDTTKAASKLLGHSGEAITDVYLHATAEELRDAVDKLPKLKLQNRNPQPLQP